VATLS